jgi:hypothetical protein
MSTKIYYVYEIIDPRTEKPFYVGWTSRKSDLRFGEHLRETRSKVINLEKVNILKDILKENLKPIMKVVYQCTDKENSIKEEIRLIDFYGRIKDGGILTNISKGGEHHVVSDEVKKYLSELRKDKTYEEILGKEKAEELKKRISESVSGKSNPMYGKKHSAESRKKMSEQLKGKIAHSVTEYQKEKIRESNKSRVWTEEMRKKMSESQKKRFKERPESFVVPEWKPESRKKMSEARKRNSAKYTFKHPEHGEFYGTTGDLATVYNFSRTSEAYKLVKGEYKSYKGWTFVN